MMVCLAGIGVKGLVQLRGSREGEKQNKEKHRTKRQLSGGAAADASKLSDFSHVRVMYSVSRQTFVRICAANHLPQRWTTIVP